MPRQIINGAGRVLVRNYWPLAGGAFALLFVFVANYNFILHHFFTEGGYLLDTAIYGMLVHEPTLNLELSGGLSRAGEPWSYLAYHVTPIHFLIGLPSHFLATNFVTMTAVYFAAVYAVAASPLILLVWKLHASGQLRLGSLQLYALLFTAPVLFAFSGPFMHGVGYPHYEFLFTAYGVFFFYFLARGNFLGANIAILFCVLTREDFVFHLSGFVFLWVAYQNLFEKKPLQELRPWLIYLVALLVIGTAVLVLQKVFLGPGQLIGSYTGWPPYAHISRPLLVQRIEAIVSGRVDLFVCFLSAAALSAMFRDLRYVLGYLACIPWIVLNVFANIPAPGTLSLYYAFPLNLAMLWPILVLLMDPSDGNRRTSQSQTGNKQAIQGRTAIVLILTLASFAGSSAAFSQRWNFRGMLNRMLPVPAELQAAGYAFQGFILGGLLDRERLGIDDSVTALAPKAIRYDQRIASSPRLSRFRGVALYANSINSDRTIGRLVREGYSRSLRVGASSLFVAAPQTEDGARLIESLRALSDGILLSEQSYLFFRMRLEDAARYISADVVTRQDEDGMVMSGPEIKLEPGSYRAEYSISKADCRASDAGRRFEIAAMQDQQRIRLSSAMVSAETLFANASCSATLGVDFQLTPDRADLPFEVPLWHFGRGAYVIKDVRITPISR